MPSNAYPGDDRYYGRGTLAPGGRAYTVGGDQGSGNLGYAAAVAQGRGGANSRTNRQDVSSPQPSAPTGPESVGTGVTPQQVTGQLNGQQTQTPGGDQSQQAIANYYANSYSYEPSVQAGPVNGQDFGPTGGANNPVQHQGVTVDPYDFGGNYQAYTGRPYDYGALIPTAGGQNDTAISPSGATFNLRPVTNQTSADYDAWRAAEYGPSWDNNSPQNNLMRTLAANPGSVTPANLQSWIAANYR
jgi:hypothetical protein